MARRRGTKLPGTPVTIYLDKVDTEALLLAARRDDITLDEAVHAVVHGRTQIRAELQNLSEYSHRLISMKEGTAIILSLIKAEVGRQNKIKLQQESKHQTCSDQSNQQGARP